MRDKSFHEINFEVFAEDEVTETLDLLIREELMECFPKDREYFSQFRIWHTRPEWTVVGFAPDGTVAAHCAMVERTISVGDRPEYVNTAGVQGFSVRPAWRKKGISDQMMEIAIAEAKRCGLDAGLLFCLPVLEKLYSRMGWHFIDTQVMVRDEQGRPAPLPEKNIVMIIPLNSREFPEGKIDLMGPDW
jgi:GNAT superfamily N-acetyltransferase